MYFTSRAKEVKYVYTTVSVAKYVSGPEKKIYLDAACLPGVFRKLVLSKI